MTDWNQNGKYDPADQYVDYKIYQDMTGTEDSTDTDCCGGSCCECFEACSQSFIGYIIGTVLLLLGLGALINSLDLDGVVLGMVIFGALFGVGGLILLILAAIKKRKDYVIVAIVLFVVGGLIIVGITTG